jgi:RNA polymerase sigma-70 factor (ECF subfamily)
MQNQHVHQTIENTFRQEAGRVRAVLLNSLRDFELVEDVLQEAFLIATERWPLDGVPANPPAWLLVTARRKAIDRLRRASMLANKQELLLTELEQSPIIPTDPFPDERLKLIFTCCHPALNMEARVALTLHTLGGLTTPEIAAAFLVPEATMAQRLVRAKRKIRAAGIPYAIPPADQLAERLDGVLTVLYLIFNAGYTASLGNELIRYDLCAEAMRLSHALVTLLPEEPEVLGLAALMLLHDARRAARVNAQGEMITLEEQDRTLWNGAQIAEGAALLEQALLMHSPGLYQIQAAISALHSQASRPEETDWLQITMLYGELLKRNNSLVIKLNWAVALAMASEPERGLSVLAELDATGSLQRYYLFHSARADLLRRAEDWQAAYDAYLKALELAQNAVERAFLQRRIKEVWARL